MSTIANEPAVVSGGDEFDPSQSLLKRALGLQAFEDFKKQQIQPPRGMPLNWRYVEKYAKRIKTSPMTPSSTAACSGVLCGGRPQPALYDW